jgi:hypothetical protein
LGHWSVGRRDLTADYTDCADMNLIREIREIRGQCLRDLRHLWNFLY